MERRVLTKHFALYRPRENMEAPIVYHPYFLVASDWETPGSGIATTMSLTDDKPAPSNPHLMVQSGGAGAALREAEERVKQLAGNEGLQQL